MREQELLIFFIIITFHNYY